MSFYLAEPVAAIKPGSSKTQVAYEFYGNLPILCINNLN